MTPPLKVVMCLLSCALFTHIWYLQNVAGESSYDIKTTAITEVSCELCQQEKFAPPHLSFENTTMVRLNFE